MKEYVLSARLSRILGSQALRNLMDYWNEREARPRVACPDCQFEYVDEEGHTCEGG